MLEKLTYRAARALRDIAAAGGQLKAMRSAKDEILEAVDRILNIHLGTPPASFDWQWTDKDKKFHRKGKMTPLQFADKYITIPIDDYVCLVHDPRPTSPSGRTFTHGSLLSYTAQSSAGWEMN